MFRTLIVGMTVFAGCSVAYGNEKPCTSIASYLKKSFFSSEKKNPDSLKSSKTQTSLGSTVGVADEASRKTVITGHEGTRFILKVDHKPVEGFFQNELERRVNLPGGFPVDLPQKTYFDETAKEWQYMTPQAHSPQELVRDLLDEFYDPRYKNPIFETELSLHPLSVKEKLFHLNGPKPKELTLNSGSLTEEIESNIPRVRKGPSDGDGNGVKMKYTVGRQHEESVYFDTPTKELESNHVAVRVKTWYPVLPDGKTSSQTTGRSLFLKTTESGDGVFTHRKEFIVPLPEGISDADVQKYISALVKEATGKPLTTAAQPIVRISNRRYGVDVVWRTEMKIVEYVFARSKYTRWEPKYQKIGFMTIDTFTSTNTKAGNPIAQFEFELLPEYQELFQKNPEKFRNFFEIIESRYAAKVNATPKYLQHGE